MIVTGASKGIGKGIARVFAGNGAKVLLVARDFAKATAAAAEIGASGGIASAVAADVSNPEDCRRMAAVAIERHGGKLWHRVGVEPSGSSFNSIVQLEQEKGIPRNPLINAGALVVTDALLEGRDPPGLIAEITGFMRLLIGPSNCFIAGTYGLS